MSKENRFTDRASYYAGAATWSEDVLGNLRASRCRAFCVAGISSLVALLEAGALAALVPLKTSVPYAITVDRQTGYVQTEQVMRPGALSQNESVLRAFIAQYVLARETFDPADLQNEYQKVAAWTVGPAREQYLAYMQRSNPASPLNLFGSDTVSKVTIKNISLLSRSTAIVQFDAERLSNGGGASQRYAYTAVIGFRFTGVVEMRDRFENPLGFRVTTYRRDAEFPEGRLEGEHS